MRVSGGGYAELCWARVCEGRRKVYMGKVLAGRVRCGVAW